MKKISTSLLLLFLISSCAKQKGGTSEDIARAVESGLAGMIGVVDEQGDQDIVDNNLAACSGRASTESCQSSSYRRKDYNCTVGNLDVTGYVVLTYGSGQTDCFINADTENVTRTFNLTRDTVFGGTVAITDTTHNNYLGNSIGGGARLTRNTATSWQIEVLGKRRVRKTSGGSTIIDISMETSSPISVSNSLTRATRTINGGTLKVYHNLAKYTSEMTPNNITYDDGCCYPTGGSVSVTFTGEVTGSASVSFSSCGNATVTKGDKAYAVQFYSCE